MELGVFAVPEVWSEVLPGVEPPAITLHAGPPLLPSGFDVERLATNAIGLAHASAAIYCDASPVSLSTRDAEVAFCSEQYLRANGEAPAAWAPLSGDYLAKDGRYVRLHCNFPHHAAAAARALGCDESKDAFVHAVAQLPGLEVEEAVVAAGGASGAARTREEWGAHPHFAAIAAQPLVALERSGDAPPVKRDRPLRVLDLTRVIAGPLAGKVLGAYGADVLHVASSLLPTIAATDIDHGFGKRVADIDLRSAEGAAALRALVREADVFLESYRPGALDHLGFGFEEVRRLRPDVIYVSLSAYGERGAWAGRRGFDSIVQLTSGIATRDGGAPQALPCQALDHATGYLAAFAAVASAIRRKTEGGAWRARVSLARTAEWLWEFGRIDRNGFSKPSPQDVAGSLRTQATPVGTLTYVPVPGSIGGRSFDDLSVPDLTPVEPRWRTFA